MSLLNRETLNWWDRSIAEVFSYLIVIGTCFSNSLNPIRYPLACLAAADTATYFALVAEVASECCLVDLYEMRQELRINAYPDHVRLVFQQLPHATSL